MEGVYASANARKTGYLILLGGARLGIACGPGASALQAEYSTVPIPLARLRMVIRTGSIAHFAPVVWW